MKKRLIFLISIVIISSFSIAFAQIKTADYEIPYGARELIDLNNQNLVLVRLHETSRVSFRYPGRTKNTMQVNNISKYGINVTMLGDAFDPGLDVFIKAEDYYRVFANKDKIPDVVIEPKVYQLNEDPTQRTVVVLLRTVEIIQGNSPTNNPVEVKGNKVSGSAVTTVEEKDYSQEIFLYSSIIIGAILLGLLYFYFERKNNKSNKENLSSEFKN
ncbi:hypothetical protein J4455_03530 [Candidatus Woesearchaeota archaeon]|nr:hypothetical protein [Candidatus Woesearchaeota archaeon]